MSEPTWDEVESTLARVRAQCTGIKPGKGITFWHVYLACGHSYESPVEKKLGPSELACYECYVESGDKKLMKLATVVRQYPVEKKI